MTLSQQFAWPLASMVVGCTSFATGEPVGTQSPPITQPPPVGGDAPVAPTLDAGAAGGGDAGAGPPAATTCTPATMIETFADSPISDLWHQQVANGGTLGLAPEAKSLPFSLTASGTFETSASGRARILRRIPVAGRTVDLTYAVRFEKLPIGVTLDVGCTLELSRVDGASARARLSERSVSGSPLSGLVASVDVTHEGAADPTVVPPPSQVLSDQFGTMVWYAVHVAAVVDTAVVSFSFDLRSDTPVEGHLEPMAVPFAAPDGILLSCGVDNAVLSTNSADPYAVLIDDVTVSSCPR